MAHDEEADLALIGGELHELVAAYRPRIYRYCRSRLIDHETSEDVTQEVCLALAEAWMHRVKIRRSVSAFVFGIAANKVALSYRNSYSRVEDASADLPERADSAPSPEQIALEHEQAVQVTRLMQRLPPATRELLNLRVAAGLSAAETAEVLGMTPGAVRVAQYRALQQLRAFATEGVTA